MRVMLLAGLIAALAAAPVAAQDGASDEANNQIVREKLRADKKLLLAENMQLTDAEAAKFWPVYDAYQAEQAKLADRTAAVIKEYAANYKTMTDPVADKLLTEMINIEKDRVKQLETYRPKFAAALPATKLARYYQLEQKIRSVINFELAEKIPLIK